LQKPKAIVFDLDGTLVDSAPDVQCALHAILKRCGTTSPELDAIRLMIGKGPEVLIRRALDAMDVATESVDVETLTLQFSESYKEQGHALTRLLPGTTRCLEQLAEQKIRTAVCSNKPDPICRDVLADLGIGRFFDCIQGSATGLPLKPDPSTLLETLRSLDTTVEQALYVGDSKTDVDTARSGGISVALVRHGYTAIPADSLDADYVVEDLADLPRLWQES
jgi:phosphoglycolate phosphatase